MEVCTYFIIITKDSIKRLKCLGDRAVDGYRGGSICEWNRTLILVLIMWSCQCCYMHVSPFDSVEIMSAEMCWKLKRIKESAGPRSLSCN